jgi:NAD(P)-dependent dehydrogenase (short-subunit alcohol dehydrogenase family)
MWATSKAPRNKIFDKIFCVNVKGMYNCMYSSMTHMKAKGGVILNMASIAGTSGLVDRFAYSEQGRCGRDDLLSGQGLPGP